MKPYRELSGRGQTQRLKHLAIEALKAYDLQIESLAQLVHFNNTTFRLKDRHGGQYVLRINRPLFHDRKAIESEIRWMSALRGDLGISTPEFVSSAAGALTVRASAKGVPEARDVVIFKVASWTVPKPAIACLHPQGGADACPDTQARRFLAKATGIHAEDVGRGYDAVWGAWDRRLRYP